MRWIKEILEKEIKTIQIKFKNENLKTEPNTVTERQMPDQKINSADIIIISQNNNLYKNSTIKHSSAYNELDANGFAIIDYNGQYHVLTTSNFTFENADKNTEKSWNSTIYQLQNISELQTFLKNGKMIYYESGNANINKIIKDCLHYAHNKNTTLVPKKTKHNKM